MDRSMDHRTPYDLLADGSKTTLTAPGGVVLGFGPGPGLSQAIFWNGVGSLFSCYRPAVAQLTLFDLAEPHQPAALKQRSFAWEPNHVHAEWAADGLMLSEDRMATYNRLITRFTARNTGAKKRAWLLFFHGQVQQWEFFDYWKGAGEPLVDCITAPRLGLTVVLQRHPHHGLPNLTSSQLLTCSQPFACHGFGLSEGDLRSLWHDHGCLASMRLRLGQVGGRFIPVESGGKWKSTFSHRHPLYYFGVRVELKPGQEQELTLDCWFDAVDRAALDLASILPPDSGRLETDGQPEDVSSPAVSADIAAAAKESPEPAVEGQDHGEEQGREKQGSEPSISTKTHDYFERKVRAELLSVRTEYCKSSARSVTIDLPQMLKRQRKQWRKYLSEGVPQLECSDAELERYWYYVWYVLRANRTAPGAHITHPFTAPSKYMYWGPWIWDGYFHSLGEMWLGDRTVAQDTIRAVLDMQFPNGFIPVCSGSDYRMCFHDDVAGYKREGGGYASYVPAELRGYHEGVHPFEAELVYDAGGAGVSARDRSRRPGTAAPPDDQQKLPAKSQRSQAKMLHNEKTQTPLIGVAAALYCALHADAAFAAEVLPALWAYEEWLWRRRTDSHGRFILWHGDESGWDDATRHYPVPAKPVDVQVHCILHRLALAQLARQAGDGAIEHEAYRRANISRTALRTYWDAHDLWHYDFAGAGDGQRSGKRRKQIAASGIFPLLVEQSERTVSAVLRALADPRVFGTAYPIPTLAACDPDYAPHGWGWNGPAWLQVNYFAITGLLAARQSAAALKLWERTRALIIRGSAPHSYELYDPELGTGIGCPDYSWQAMINHLVIHHFAGIPVGSGAVTPCLPAGMDYLRLRNLPGGITWIEHERDKRGWRIRLGSSAPPSFDLGLLGEIGRVKLDGKPVELVDGKLAASTAGKMKDTWEVTLKWR